MITTIVRRLEWDAGHRVPLHGSKCKHLHGHRYAAEIEVAADRLSPEGFVIDFGLVKELVGGWIDMFWDHAMILQQGDPAIAALFSDRQYIEAVGGSPKLYAMAEPPTAEHLAAVLLDESTELLKDSRIQVISVTVHETPNCRAKVGR